MTHNRIHFNSRSRHASVLIMALLVSCASLLVTAQATFAAERKLPELWIHGVPMQPERLKPLNAKGGRMFVDLRKLDGRGARAHLQRYANLDLGICLTLRWMDPANKDAPDIAPTPQERAEKTEMLMEILKSPESKAMSGRIWVQFFNEVTGGPGTINVEDADTMFGWATETALRIRKEAPHIKICGPALTALDNLERDPRTLTRLGQNRRDGLMRSIAWSAEFADAIDIHLHMADGDTARRWIRLLRGLLDKQPGGEKTQILSWEWSPARFEPQSDLNGARDTLIDIYRAMAENDFPIAAYATYYPALAIGQIFHWQSVVNKENQPNEPFYSTLAKLGANQIDLGLPNRGGDEGGGNPSPNPGGGGGSGLTIESQLWVSGSLGHPQAAAEAGAAGVHGSLDMPAVGRQDIVTTLRDHARLRLGLALTLRWPDPADPEQHDAMPNRRFVRQKSAQLVQALGSRYAREMAEQDRLWIQFGGEVAGGVGAWRPADAPQFLEIATELASEIRSRHQGVRFVGPALTHTEVLAMPNPSGPDLERKQLLEQAIEWSVQHADAVDVRLPSAEPAEIEAAVTSVREVMKRFPGGEAKPIISLGWNAADPTEKGQTSKLQASMQEAWDKMRALGVNLAAYGPMLPVQTGAGTDANWVALLASERAPSEPFHGTYVEMAKALGQAPLEAGGEGGGGSRPTSGGGGGDGGSGSGGGDPETGPESRLIGPWRTRGDR